MAEHGNKSGEQDKKRPRLTDKAEGSGAKKSSVVAMSTVSPADLAVPSPVAQRRAALSSPSPVAKAKSVTTVGVTSPLVAMPPAPSPVATKTMTPGPAPIAKPAAMVKPDEEGVEQGGEAMVAAAWEEEPATLNLPKKLFHCAACRAPLKPPVFKCDKDHFVCCACGRNGGGDGATKHCGPCGHDVSYAHSAFMDGVVGAYKVPCTYRHHGCASSIVYHAAAEHNDKCAHAPCYCFECTPPFEGSPAQLLRHLTAPSGKHSWPMDKIKYESSYPFAVQAPSGEYRCLLVGEDGCVFLLAVGASRGPTGRRPVNVVCVRANTDADTRPVYTGVLWVDGPPAPTGQLMCTFRHQATMASCSVPGEVDMEQGWLHAHVNPSMLHGESGEVHLRLRITKFP
ncbi:hypothetical protein ZWY2020_031479 [Hordeum vulgare]|nr:hypothetical protein ZWY2020_031479 [Hordeum vulgare]